MIDLSDKKLKTIPEYWRDKKLHINCCYNKIRSLKNCQAIAINFVHNKIKSVKHAIIGIWSYRDRNKIKDNSYLDLVYDINNKYLYLCHRKFRNKFSYKLKN